MNSEIRSFYSSANVLITGATGLFGKLLIQKLLQTCTDLSGLYLIIRAKKEKSATERLEEIFKDVVFDKLKAENPEFSKKIYAVDGDCSLHEFGLNQMDRKLLVDKINVVFHCAAELNMDAKIKVAVNTNVRGLSDLLELCHEMRFLKSMVFVSTAYSNCNQHVIEEKLYEVPIQATTLIKLTQEIDDNMLDKIQPGLVDTWPNTYCFSKAVAENMLSQNAGNLPVGIFRPSMVTPTYSDPIPGWTSNVYGPVGVMLIAGLGILRVFFAEPHKQVDLVPADLCVNALICSAWEINQQRQNGENSTKREVPVFNYSGGSKRNITWFDIMKNTENYEFPLKDVIWSTVLILTNNRITYNFLWFFLHTIPGYLMDMCLWMMGKKTRLVKAYKKIAKFSQVLNYFTTREWDIMNNNVDNLWKRLNETDKELFPFDMNVMDYKEYLHKVCLGIKLYVMKENLNNAEAEKKRYKRFLMAHNTLKAVFQIFMLIILYKSVILSISLMHKLVD